MTIMSEPTLPDSRATGDADFLDRLRREELRVDTTELADNPFERKANWRSTVRATGTRAWAAGALAIAVLMVAWHLQPQGSPTDDVVASSPDGIVRLTAADPRSLRKQIVDDLRATGVQAAGYEQLGINGIDADLPLPIPTLVVSALQKHRIPPPADGSLRIVITTQ